MFATAAGTVRLTSGSSVKSFTVPAGITRLEAPLTAGAGINVKLIRNSKNAIDYTPSFTFAGAPPLPALRARLASSVGG